MWIETIEGYIVNSDTLEKIEINYPNTSVSHSKAEPIRLEENIEEMSDVEREELRQEMEALGMLKVSKESEEKEEPMVVCEIWAWSANKEDKLHILFRGEKEDCELNFSDLKKSLGTH